MNYSGIARRSLSLAVLGALVAASLPGVAIAKPATTDPAAKVKSGKVKNIIVMISDGMGYNQMLAADYYLYGAAKASFAGMPFKSAMSTYAIGDSYDPAQAWASFDYAKQHPTDSSAAATAMSTGMKTYNGAIGVDVDGKPIVHMMQAAEEQGMATGVVSSVEFSHATPAGFVAHNVSRNNYVAIADEMVHSSATDVIMGAGSPWYNDDGTMRVTASFRYIGEPAWNTLVAGTPAADADGDGTGDAWTLVQTRDEFLALTEGDTPARVCGVPQVFTTLQQARPGDGLADAYEVPFTPGIPTLEEMTEGALNVLDNDQNGFVLMIEGGAVDWAGHANQSGRVIEEQVDFVNTYKAVNTWVEENSNWGETLLIVTGDHETGYLTGVGSGQLADGPVWKPLISFGVGQMPSMQWNSGDHTNVLIPFYAKGSAAHYFKGYADEVDSVRGAYIDNTEIAALCFKLLGQ
ncbi:MAG: alkaline phosphatase [Coriobacteriia bacterium]